LKNLTVPVMAIGNFPRTAPPLRALRIGRTGHSLPEAWPSLAD
jgi:hypothetical protein